MSKEEVEIAYELALQNDNKFTEQLFQENIQRFRNLLHSSTPYHISDFPNFLKKLTYSKLFGIQVEHNGSQYGILRDSTLVEKLKMLQPYEYQVFCTVETAANKGIWIKDIKKITGLTFHQINKSLKTLSEVARIISRVSSIHYKNRKLYILPTLEPSINITGGSFYLDGQFNELLVEKMQEQIGLFLANNQGSTISQIIQFLKSLNIIQGELCEEDVSKVIDLLILEDKVYSAPIQNDQHIYIWCGSNNIKFAEEAFSVPCFGCNLIESCNFGSASKVCPTKCNYLTTWLSLKESNQ